MPATLDGVALAVVRLDDGVQRMAFVAWRVPLCCRFLYAHCVGDSSIRHCSEACCCCDCFCPQLVLKGLNPCLEVEEEGSQLPHQGQHGFFALHVGGMHIVAGR